MRSLCETLYDTVDGKKREEAPAPPEYNVNRQGAAQAMVLGLRRLRYSDATVYNTLEAPPNTNSLYIYNTPSLHKIYAHHMYNTTVLII
jgi:hypothetical protein